MNQQFNQLTFLFVHQVRKRKQLEFQKSKLNSKDSRSDDDFFTTPQIFVNELLKMHEMGTINAQELDDQVMTMLVGVSYNNRHITEQCFEYLSI